MELAYKLNAFFWEVSALKGDSIKEIFQRIAFLVLDRQCYSLNKATEANADIFKTDFINFKTSQTGF
jgi:hypothetical protein